MSRRPSTFDRRLKDLTDDAIRESLAEISAEFERRFGPASPVVGDREAIGRIVDPTAFQLKDEIDRVSALDPRDQPDPDYLARAASTCSSQVEKALAKADAILSLSTPVVGGGLPELLTAIDAWVADGTPETEQGILDARAAFPDPHTMDRAGMAQEVEQIAENANCSGD